MIDQALPTRRESPTLQYPDELLTSIISHLPTHDVLNFRRSNTHFAPACTSALQGRLSRLYICPLFPSLRAAIDICRHPGFSQSIAEIVIVGKYGWPVLDCGGKCLQKAPPPRTGPHLRKAPRARGHCYGIGYFCAPATAFHRERLSLLESELESQLQPTSPDQVSKRSIAVAYALLIDALKNLPRLEGISTAELAAEPGFNAVSRFRPTDKDTCKRHPFKVEAEGPGRHRWHKATSRPDIEVVFGLLSSLPGRFTRLKLGSQLADTIDVVRDEDSAISKFRHLMESRRTGAVALRVAITNLRTVEVHLPSAYLRGYWQQFLYMGLSRISTLESLRIVYKPDSTIYRNYGIESLRFLMTDVTWPNLKSLDIVSLPLAAHATALQRPVCVNADLIDFLNRHESSLTAVRLSNALFAHSRDSVVTTRTILDLVARSGGIETFSMRVNRASRGPGCFSDPANGSRRKCWEFRCGQHLPGTGGESLLHYDQLAKDLGVALDARGETWEFGDYVRRKRQIGEV